MKDTTHTATLVLVVVTLIVAIGGTYFTVSAINNKLVNLGFTPITGFALIPNGTATLSVTTTSSIVFTSGTVDFGTGNVNTSAGFNNCSLITIPNGQGAGVNNIGCAAFNTVSNGFTIENDGNTNLSVTLRSNVSASQFIGSSTAGFLWNVTINESSSCYNVSGSDIAVSPNTTSNCGSDLIGANNCGGMFETVSTTAKTICPRLRYEDANDALDIDINVTVPVDAPTGVK